MQDSIQNSEVLLDAPSVAKMLGTSTFFVRKNIPFVRLGFRCLRYRLADVQAFILARQSKKV